MAKRLKHLDPSPNVETLEEKIEQRKRTNAMDGDLINTPLTGRDETRTMAEMVEDDTDKI
jgi:hypothetical protein